MIDLDAYQLEIVLSILDELAPQCEARAYGSRAAWTARDHSDLDLALLGPEPLPPPALWALQEAFEESELNIRVDVGDWRAFSDGFRRAIADDCVVIRQPMPVPTAGGIVLMPMSNNRENWQAVVLGDLITIVRGRSYRSVQLQDNPDTALVTLKSFQRGGGYRDDGLKPYVGPFNADQVVHPGELVVAQTDITQDGDVVGRPAIVPQHTDYHNLVASLDAAIVRNADSKRLDLKFLYYRLMAKDYAHHAKSMATGTTVLHLSKDALPSFEFRLPPLAEQRRIAQTLGALDDRIELNRQMNATLDAMCRALFQSWFVDFEPVRAKMSGRWPAGQTLPGLPAALWAQFPSALTDTELGPAPAGWAVSTVGKCFNLTMGQSPPGHTYTDTGDGMPFFQGCADFGFRYPSKRRYCTAPARIAEKDDTLVSVRAPVGTLNMAYERCCIGRGLAALRHKSGSASYTYHTVESLQREIRQYEQDGTVFGAINKRQFEALATLEPPADVIAAFDGIVAPLTERIFANSRGTCALAALRDTILPRLVSGELSPRTP